MNPLPLRDIHLPEAVSWWPLPPGWWLLLLLSLLLVVGYFAFRHFYKKIKSRIDYKKLALNELSNIKQHYADKPAPVELLRELSALLRRIAISYLPRESVASVTGAAWLQQLNQLSGASTFSESYISLLTQGVYQTDIDFDSATLLRDCENWIKQLPDQPLTASTHPGSV